MKNKRIVCVMLILGMLVSSGNADAVFANTKDGGKEIFLDNICSVGESTNSNIENEEVKLEEHQKVLKLMGWQDEYSDESDLKDNYAGSYLDEDGKMFVLLDENVKGNKELEKKLKRSTLIFKLKRLILTVKN